MPEFKPRFRAHTCRGGLAVQTSRLKTNLNDHVDALNELIRFGSEPSLNQKSPAP